MKRLLHLGTFDKILCCIFFIGHTSLVICQTIISESKVLSVTAGLRSGNILSSIDNGLIYFTPTFVSEKSARFIYVIDKSGLFRDSIVINEKNKKGIGTERIVQFSISDNLLVVLCPEQIYFYNKIGNSFFFDRSIKNSYSFSGLERLGNGLLLYVCYPFHPLDQKETNVWAKINLSKKVIEEIHIPEIDNTQFGYFVNSWVSTFDTTIAHASTTEYKIVFYNEFYQPFDSIVRNEGLFGIDTISVNNRSLYSKEGIADFMKLDDEKFTRIRKIFMLDDKHLLVLSKLSKETSFSHFKTRLDIWEKNLDGWKIKNQVLGDDMYIKGGVYDEQHLFLGNLFQNVYDLRISEGNVYCVSFPYYPKVITESFDKEKDIDAFFKGVTEFKYGLEKFTFGNN